jgi:hypothetical protein
MRFLILFNIRNLLLEGEDDGFAGIDNTAIACTPPFE